MSRLLSPNRVLLIGLLLVGLIVNSRVAQATSLGLIITEVMAANTSTVADDRGSYSDWIELHNPTDMPVSLAGYTLTDDPAAPAKWSLPVTTLAPGAFLVVWASGRDQVTPDSSHTNFRLSRGGEYVGLFDPDGQVVDEVAFGPQTVDVSLGRLSTLSGAWVSFSTPTPGAANTTRHHLRAPPEAPPVEVAPGSGRFADPVTVQLYTPVPGSLLHYTLDGSDPTVDGHEYTTPIEVTETTVLRTVALDAGVPVSAVTTAAYLVGESTGLPVLSLVTDPAHLWNEEQGIYVNPEQRGRHWERPVTVAWLSPEGSLDFNVGAGLRVHGGVGRGMAKKSFRLYFRGAYGPRELAYPLFGVEPGQTYNRLVLRAGANDSWFGYGKEAAYVRAQLVRELHGAMGQAAARGRWVEVYLNGVYWGLYNLTERIDEAFLTTHFGHDDWDQVPTEGQARVAWSEFADWLTSADLRAAAQYEQVLPQFDIENFTSFIILHLWAGNFDWGSHNWYAARMRAGPDALWRLFVWDAEITFGLGWNTAATYDFSFSQRVIYGGLDASLILASLLASPQYQAYFAAQVERHLAGALATESVRERLAAMTAELRPAISAEAVRWLPDQEPDVAVAQWEAVLQRVSDSLEANTQRLRQLSDPETLRQTLPIVPLADDRPPVRPLPPGTRIALLVHHPAELTSGDAAVMAHLAERGVTATVVGIGEDSAHDPAQVAASHDLILLSSSVQSLDLAVPYTQTATPLIFWEPQLLGTTQLAHWGGTRPEQIYLRFVDADHPIIAGLTAGLPVGRPLRVVRRPDTFSYAYPLTSPGVHVLAKHLFGDDAAILVAEAGAELLNGQPAQARTVFLFWHHDTFHRGTGEAVRLFDRAVDWALGLPSG